MLTWALMLALTPTGYADHALVVLSGETEHYRSASDACIDELERDGHTARAVTLESLSESTDLAETDGIIAIGGKAAGTLARTLRPDVRLHYTLVRAPKELGLTERENTSGISAEVALGDQLDLIRGALPKARRLGVLYRSRSASSQSRVDQIRSFIGTEFDLITVDLDDPAISSPMDGIRKLFEQNVDIMWAHPDPAVYDGAVVKAVLLEALRNRIAVFGFSAPMVRAGSLIGVSVDPSRQGRRVAQMFDEGRTGEHTAPDAARAVNLVVADRIGQDIPDSIVREAEVVFGDTDND